MIPPVTDKLTVLFITSEVAPLIKTGGLADVSASLPVALMHSGVDIRVLVPGYPSVIEGIKSKGRLTSFPAIGELPQCQLLAGKLPNGVPALIVDSTLFNRPGGPYNDANGFPTWEQCCRVLPPPLRGARKWFTAMTGNQD
jgi:starch synthase